MARESTAGRPAKASSLTGYPFELTGAHGGTRLVGTITFTDPLEQPGARWYDGGGPPDDRYGTDGDYYLDDDNGDVYRKENGVWQ